MSHWLNHLRQRLGLPFVLKIHTLPYGAEPGFEEAMMHASFQCLIDLVSNSDFRLSDHADRVQQEIVELCWWWKTVRPYRAALIDSVPNEAQIEARIVYREEDSEMLERLVTLRSRVAI